MAGLYKLLKCIDFFALCVATISFSSLCVSVCFLSFEALIYLGFCFWSHLLSYM